MSASKTPSKQELEMLAIRDKEIQKKFKKENKLLAEAAAKETQDKNDREKLLATESKKGAQTIVSPLLKTNLSGSFQGVSTNLSSDINSSSTVEPSNSEVMDESDNDNEHVKKDETAKSIHTFQQMNLSSNVKLTSYIWQDMDMILATTNTIFESVNQSSPIAVLTLLKSDIFASVSDIQHASEESKAKALKAHCIAMKDILVLFITSEDPDIIKNISTPQDKIQEVSKIVKQAHETSILSERVQALENAEEEIFEILKIFFLSVQGAIAAQKKSNNAWHRFQSSTSSHSISGNVGGSSLTVNSDGYDSPKIKFVSSKADTVSLPFENALAQPPQNFTTSNSTTYGILMNMLSDTVGKNYPKEHVKSAKKLICSLQCMTRDELVKESIIFFNITLPKECAGLNPEDGLMGKLCHCFRKHPIDIDEQSKSGIYDPLKDPKTPSQISAAISAAWDEVRLEFPHHNRNFGFESVKSQIYLYLDQDVYMKLLKRTVYQRYIYGLLIQVADSIESYPGTSIDSEHDDKLSTADSARLKYILLKYQVPTSRAHAINQTNGPKVEPIDGAILIAHKFFAGLSCATDLLSEFFTTLSSQQGEFYLYHLALYTKTISDILVGNLTIPVKRLYMLATAQALDSVTVVAGGIPTSFGQTMYLHNNIEKHAIGAPDTLARLLLAHISTQLQFRPEMTQAFKSLVNEKEITEFANQGHVYDGSASTYLDNLISKLQHNKIETKVDVDSSGFTPAVLFPYPKVTKYTVHCVELRTNDLHTNLFVGVPTSKLPTKKLKSAKTPKLSPISKPLQQTNENNVTAGYKEGVTVALQCLKSANGNAIVMATEFAKHVNKLVPAFTAQAKNPDALLHPLTLSITDATWQQPMAKGTFLAPLNFGQFIVLRELLGFKNKVNKERILPPELSSLISILNVATISKNVTN